MDDAFSEEGSAQPRHDAQRPALARGATVSTSTPTIPTSSPIPIRCCG
ncbi:hypothetical protein P4114_22745 [Pseudomonas aeruginosa]|nr:hypothetical protein [Pseudomonas aeruginosa]